MLFAYNKKSPGEGLFHIEFFLNIFTVREQLLELQPLQWFPYPLFLRWPYDDQIQKCEVQ